MVNQVKYALLSTLLCAAASAAAAAGAGQIPAVWPDQFSVDFLTNITTGSNERNHSIANTLYYDWNLKAQAVVHGPGAFECAHFYNTTGGCTLLFTAKEMYRLLAAPTMGQQDCCIDLPDLGTVPPTWASLGTFLGNISDPFNGVLVEEYAFPASAGPMGMHSYLETAQSHKPASFTFPSDDGLQDYHFLEHTQVIGPQKKAMFDVPADCLGVLCTKK
jgi:hypothetical protein